MDALLDTLTRVMKEYAVPGVYGDSRFAVSDDNELFTVVTYSKHKGEYEVDSDLIVRIVGGKIVIHRDTNSRLLVDSLVNAGVSREKIVLAYAGEPVDEELPQFPVISP